MSVVVSELINLYLKEGQSDYIGEKVSQIQHALQAAELAKQAGFDEQIILGAFLHDLGHLIGLQNEERMVTDGIILGVQNHDKIGEQYLSNLGFPEKTCKLVGMHVQAKRYLVATNKEYYENLSSASKMTLEHQGGPMSSTEVAHFEVNPLKDAIIQMRQWDEKAKDPDWFSSEKEIEDGLNDIKRMMTHCFN